MSGYDHAKWMAHSTRSFAFAAEGRARDWAVEQVRGDVEQGWTLAQLLSVNGGGCGGGYWYTWKQGKITVTEIGDKPCHKVFRIPDLYREACALIAGKPRQAALWEGVPA